MGGKRQKNQLMLAFMAEDTGEASWVVIEGTEPSAAKRRIKIPAIGEAWMEEVCERDNSFDSLGLASCTLH